MEFNSVKNNINTFDNMLKKMTSSYEYKINNKLIIDDNDKEFTFDNYISTTFNIKTAYNFTSYQNLNNKMILILNIKKEHNIPGIYLSDLFFSNSFNYSKIEKSVTSIKDYEFEILLNRNFKIKILNIKNIELEKYKSKIFSINNLYDTKKTKKNINANKPIMIKYKIIYAESCPYVFPEKFVPLKSYKYLVKKLKNSNSF
jgi:hypothetical protein